ncbi:uncharacterized protein BJX67DRAFT_378682 [Aspergillus lucknowensis]|uniref:Uncharacterized protein n=1 Tax=Aspergillus lucknowensis TaxID=176173 RepID=A0ABR4M098_9EURO
MNNLPTSIRVAQAIGLTGAGYLAGNIASYSLATVPALLKSHREHDAPLPLIVKQWREMYSAGKAQNPPIAAVTAAAFAYLAWSVHSQSATALTHLAPSNATTLYSAAAALALAIVPWTLGAMRTTNKLLLDRAAATWVPTERSSEQVEELLGKWIVLNGVRGVFPFVAGVNPLCVRLPRLSRLPKQCERRLTTTVPQIGPYTVTVQGPWVDSEDAPDHKEPLLAQLKSIPRDTTTLTIDEDPPSDTEWDILANHFTAVRDLTIDSGFNEDLNDAKMPLHWPLEKLQLWGPCGEVTKSPHILQGRVGHLVLYFASELRFEGPTSRELSRAHDEAIERGEAQKRFLGKSGIQVVHMTELAQAWLREKCTAEGGEPKDGEEEAEHRPVDNGDDVEKESQMHTLEIIENDALDTFLRMSLALPHVVENLTTLNLRSTSNPPDCSWIHESMLGEVLPQLTQLQTLKLSVGEVFSDESSLPALYAWLPPNLTTLHFRGPVSLARSARWSDWVAAFASAEFLPRLERLAFVLDLHYAANEYDRKELAIAPDDLLDEARAACKRLCEAVRRRGVTIEGIQDEWAGQHVCLRPVDHRW